MSKLDNIAYLQSRGWHNKDSFWYDTNNEDFKVGLHREEAVRIQIRRDEELDDKVGLRDGTLKVLCNECGSDCQIRHLGPHLGTHMGYYGLIKAKVTGGYFSEHLQDATRYKFSLCEKCLKELFDGFKIPVDTEECFL